jgi:hypothetical protein
MVLVNERSPSGNQKVPLQTEWNYWNSFNLLKPTGYGMTKKLNILTTVRFANTVFVCFVFV